MLDTIFAIDSPELSFVKYIYLANGDFIILCPLVLTIGILYAMYESNFDGNKNCAYSPSICVLRAKSELLNNNL